MSGPFGEVENLRFCWPGLHGDFENLGLSKEGLTFYSIIMPLKYHVFENIMENGAFAPKEQMLHFSDYLQKYSKHKSFLIFSMLSKNRK